ncbi:MAG: M20/M25/M40 family metallo-hydrolase [Xanthobacteraceae bacterium]|nr:M20/M25/M40 family metallo-hydrolase [Xanthobacteraceae bacterium]
MTPEQSIEAFVDENFDRETAFLADLVMVPTDNPPGDCAAHAERTGELLTGLGLEVEAHKVPSPLVSAAGMRSITNLVVRHRFGDGPVIALNAHGDVVPPGLGWDHDPYGATIEDGKHGKVMYGRGVAVSKSDFATYTFALLALRDLAGRAPLRGAVELHFTYDEEVGGNLGPRWILENNLSKPDYAIAAGFSYNVVNAHNGCLHLETAVTGKQAHAAQPDSGRDALEAAAAILATLYKFRPRLARRKSKTAGITAPTLNVGTIAGGIATNVVPDRVALRIDRRIIPEENRAEAENELHNLIASAVKPFRGIKVETKTLLYAEPLSPRPGWERLADALRRHASRILRTRIGVKGVPLYTDARHYAARDIPIVLYGAGPRTILEANAHNANENLRLDDLRAATKIVALAVRDVLMTG